MPTFQDVCNVCASADAAVALFGAIKEWKEEYGNRMRAIGDAIKKDLGLSDDARPELSPETKLGPRATHAFESFHEWVKATAHRQADSTEHGGKLE